MFTTIRDAAKSSVAATPPPTLPLAISPQAPDVGEVVSGFDLTDVATIAIVGGGSFPIGYAISKPIRVPGMWTMGFLGTVCGFLLAYQNSCGKCLENQKNIPTTFRRFFFM